MSIPRLIVSVIEAIPRVTITEVVPTVNALLNEDESTLPNEDGSLLESE